MRLLLWDTKQKTLFIARDRIGKKPLHYSTAHGNFVFASEIKALLQHPARERELDFASLNKYLAYRICPGAANDFPVDKKTRTRPLPIYRHGKVVNSQYWDIPIEDHPISDRTEAQYVEELKELLQRAVHAGWWLTCRLGCLSAAAGFRFGRGDGAQGEGQSGMFQHRF